LFEIAEISRNYIFQDEDEKRNYKNLNRKIQLQQSNASNAIDTPEQLFISITIADPP